MKLIFLLSTLSLSFVTGEVQGNGYNHQSNEEFSRSKLKIMKRQLLQSEESFKVATKQCVPGVDAACTGYDDSGNLRLQQQGCTDEAPPNATFSCSLYAQLNYCNNLGDYCNKSCGKCGVCEDILVPGIDSCSTVVSTNTCGDPGIKGIYCNKSCNNCAASSTSATVSASVPPAPTPTPPPTSSIISEVAALEAFRDAISDPSQLSDWVGSSPCSDRWTGISCIQNQVTIIEYTGTDVDTSIPPEFSVLKQLKKLLLVDDAITGTLPPELSLLVNMEEFDIKDHTMKGTIPIELSTWTNIQNFDLEASANGIRGNLPKQFSTWVNLERFDMFNNQLSGTLPPELSTWSNNDYIQLSENEFSGSVPEEYSYWDRYTDLYWSPQSGTGFCVSQSLLNYLIKTVADYDINESPICSSPSSNPEAVALYQFKNQVDNPSLLESWVGDDPCNNWEGVTCQNTKVSVVEYTYSTDAGTAIPPEFSELKSLKKLLLSGDGITGTIPRELSVLVDMEEFDITDHAMQGTIPQQLSTWTSIQIFDLEAASGGSLTGRLPQQLSEWTNLQKFDILENDLSGTLPPELSKWSNNDYIQLSENKFSGSVPEEYSMWRSYSDLYLSPQGSSDFCISQSLQDYLIKSVSSYDIDEMSICSQSSQSSQQSSSSNREANALYQFKNSISDPSLLGSWVGDDPCDNWEGISCDINQVSVVEYTYSTDAETSIPPEFSELKGIKKILLSSDAITGTIPPELSVLVEMEEFIIEDHSMKGAIPQQLSTWTSIQIFDLEAASGGSLIGRLPRQFSKWTNLKKIDILENDLSGTLPRELSTWSNNDYIQFSENKFSGSVPEEYSLWRSYADLYLSPQGSSDFCISQSLQDYLIKQVSSYDIDELTQC